MPQNCVTKTNEELDMARAVLPLNNTKIEKSKPKETEYNLSDGEGLHLRIKPSGSKIWLFNYVSPITKRRTNLRIGKYPEISLADARLKRSE